MATIADLVKRASSAGRAGQESAVDEERSAADVLERALTTGSALPQNLAQAGFSVLQHPSLDRRVLLDPPGAIAKTPLPSKVPINPADFSFGRVLTTRERQEFVRRLGEAPPGQQRAVLAQAQVEFSDPVQFRAETIANLKAARDEIAQSLGMRSFDAPPPSLEERRAQLEVGEARARERRGGEDPLGFESMERQGEIARLSQMIRTLDDPNAFIRFAQFYQADILTPFVGMATAMLQSSFVYPGQQEIEKKYTALREQGIGKLEAGRRAFETSDLPPGIKGLLEIGLDPANFLPVVGFGGTIVKTTARTASLLALTSFAVAGVPVGTVKALVKKAVREVAELTAKLPKAAGPEAAPAVPAPALSRTPREVPRITGDDSTRFLEGPEGGLGDEFLPPRTEPEVLEQEIQLLLNESRPEFEAAGLSGNRLGDASRRLEEYLRDPTTGAEGMGGVMRRIQQILRESGSNTRVVGGDLPGPGTVTRQTNPDGSEFLLVAQPDGTLVQRSATKATLTELYGAKAPGIGPDLGREGILNRLRLEVDAGQINPDVVDFAEQGLKLFPDDLMRDLSISLQKSASVYDPKIAGPDDLVAGLYQKPNAFGNLENPVINIFKEAFENKSGDMGRTIIHEFSHHLENFVPAADLRKLSGEWLADFKANAVDDIATASAALELSARGLLSADDLAAATHRAYRHTNFGEWFAEVMTNQAVRQIAVDGLSQRSRSIIERMTTLARRLMVEFYNLFIKTNRFPQAEQIFKRLRSGGLGADDARPATFDIRIDQAVREQDLEFAAIADLLEPIRAKAEALGAEAVETAIGNDLLARGTRAGSTDFVARIVEGGREALEGLGLAPDVGISDLTKFVENTLAPGKGHIEVPNQLMTSTRNPAGLSPGARRLGDILEDYTGDRALVNFARDAMARDPLPDSGMRGRWNRGMDWVMGQTIEPVRGLPQAFRDGILQTKRFLGAAQEYTRARTVAGLRALEQGFGKEMLRAGEIDQRLADSFRLPTTPANAKYVGTLWHILDDYVPGVLLPAGPSNYTLTGVMREAVELWGKLTDGDLKLMTELGYDQGTIQGIWISHGFKDSEKAFDAVMNSRGMGIFKQRKHTTEEFLEIALKNNLEVETDVTKILAKRLNYTTNQRMERVFFDGMVRRLDGRVAATSEMHANEQAIFSGGKTYLFKKADAAQLEDLMRQMRGSVSPDRFRSMVNGLKGIMLNGDFSIAGGRQGLMMAASNPKEWGRTWTEAIRLQLDPEYNLMHLGANAHRYAWWAQRGLQLTQTAEGVRLGIPGARGTTLMERLPIIGPINAFQFHIWLRTAKIEIANSWMSNLQILRDGGRTFEGVLENLPLMGALVKRTRGQLTGMTDEALGELVADFTNNWMGGIEWAKIMAGEPSGFRSALILTEGWSRARVGNIANFPKASPKGIMARRALLQEQMALGLFSFGINGFKLGWDDALLDGNFFDPRSSDYMTIRLGDNRVRLTVHAPEIKAVARFFFGTDEDDWQEGSEFLKRVDHILRFVEDRRGQPVSMIHDAVTGTDAFGRSTGDTATQRVLHAAQQALPIVAQNLTEQAGDPNSVEMKSLMGGLEFLGIGTWPAPLRTQLGDLAQKKFPHFGRVEEFYDDLEPFERDQVLVQPEARELIGRLGSRDLNDRMQVRWDAYDQQLARDKTLTDGTISEQEWVEQREHARIVESTELRFISELTGAELAPAEDPKSQALESYYRLQEQFDQPETGTFDIGGWSEARSVLLEDMPPVISGYVERNTNRYETPKEREYRAAQTLMRPYWDVGRTPEFAAQFTPIWERFQDASALVQSGMLDERTGNPGEIEIIRRLISKQRALRDRLRGRPFDARGDAPVRGATEEEIALDKVLVIWLGYTAKTAEGALLENRRKRIALKRSA